MIILSQIVSAPLTEAEVQWGESSDVIRVLWMLHCSIHNNENYGSDTESLPNLDELLASRCNPDTSDDEGAGGQENADSLELEHRALSLWAILAGWRRWQFRVKARHGHNQTLALAVATEETLTAKTLTFKTQTGENLTQYRPTVYSPGLQWCHTHRSLQSCKYSSLDYTGIMHSIA